MDWRQRPRCDEAPAWPLLQAHFARRFEGPGAFDLRRAFAQDAGRAAAFSLDAGPVFADLSKNLIDLQAQRLLTQLAHECGVPFFACGHHATERYGAPALAAQVAAQLGIEHQFIDIDNPA